MTISRSTRDLRRQAIVVVRPDGYISTVQPLDATDAIAEFFDGIFTARTKP